MSKIEVDAIDKQSGSTLTLGGSGTAVTLGTGATQTGFGRTGTVNWQTGSIKTATFTAANGEGYFANTSGGAFTMNLPAGSAGAIVSVVDYTNTFQTNNLTISPNGTEKIGGVAADAVLSTEGQSVTFVYIDGTEGWKNVQDSTSNATGNPNLVATGGTITEDGNFKIHTFTGPGTFTVCKVSCTVADNTVSYLVLAGGGSASGITSGGNAVGGAGAGGYRENKSPVDTYSASPSEGSTDVVVTAQGYAITVGGGAAGGSGSAPVAGGQGNPSTGIGITSAGGGAGGSREVLGIGGTGGSGGGAGGGGNNSGCRAAGNTPPVSPSQGNAGGSSPSGPPDTGAGGGGGAGAVGSDAAGRGGNGGNGQTTSISGSPVAYGGGGGGGAGPPQNTSGTAGTGGGGTGGTATNPGSGGTTNRGGGGGGGGLNAAVPGAQGGSGIVIIRYKFQ